MSEAKQYNKKLIGIWINKSKAKSIARHIKGTGLVTHSDHVGPKKIMAYDSFDFHSHHPNTTKYLCETLKKRESDFV